jgi:hypothetical protein
MQHKRQNNVAPKREWLIDKWNSNGLPEDKTETQLRAYKYWDSRKVRFSCKLDPEHEETKTHRKVGD